MSLRYMGIGVPGRGTSPGHECRAQDQKGQLRRKKKGLKKREGEKRKRDHTRPGPVLILGPSRNAPERSGSDGKGLETQWEGG